MSVRLNGSTSGYVELDAPAVAANNTLKLPTSNGSAGQSMKTDGSGNLSFDSAIVSGTAQSSTSGTAIDFTGIPSWVKRITVMFNGVSTNGTSDNLVRIGAGSVVASGYTSLGGDINNSNGTATVSSTAGFLIRRNFASDTLNGHMILTLSGSNTWISSHTVHIGSANGGFGGGSISLGGTLDRVRITTVNGTDLFDAGSINILYE